VPDRGLLDRPPSPVGPLLRHAGWMLTGVRLAQLTFEVDREAALAVLPTEASRPVPCYARLVVLEAEGSPAGPIRLAALLAGARYKMFPRNVLVDGIVDGPVEAFAAAFGGPFRQGSVTLTKREAEVTATVAADGEDLGRLVLPAARAVEPSMLRWDAWLGYAASGGAVQLIEYAPRAEIREAFLSKGATLGTSAALPRTHVWRRFRNLKTISACYFEGDLWLSAPEFQQAP